MGTTIRDETTISRDENAMLCTLTYLPYFLRPMIRNGNKRDLEVNFKVFTFNATNVTVISIDRKQLSTNKGRS